MAIEPANVCRLLKGAGILPRRDAPNHLGQWAAVRAPRLAFVRLCGMTHVHTSPYYPQGNGKVARWHQTVERECIRPQGRVLPDWQEWRERLNRDEFGQGIPISPRPLWAK